MEIEFIERILFSVIILGLLIILAKYKIDSLRKKRVIKKRFERGNLLEAQAREFLESKNYKILEEQKTYHHKYLVNGVSFKSKLILDYVVKKKDKIYIVEVKSGTSAIHLKNKDTRRQLLEYDFAIENDGVFVLDMENQNLQLVEFQSKKDRDDSLLRNVIVVIALIGIAVPFWGFRISLGLVLLLIWKFPKTSTEIIRVFHKSS